METKNLNLTIDKYEAKTAKVSGKPYMRFHTENGWITCFDKTMAMDIINGSMNIPLTCEVSVGDDGRMVLKKVLGTAALTEAPTNDPWAQATTPQPIIIPIEEPKRNKAYDKDPIGLAVEVFCAIKHTETNSPVSNQTMMATAITLVKQAQDNFK